MIKIGKFTDFYRDVTKEGTKIPQEKYLQSGRYPVIDQGRQAVAGRWDSNDGIFEKVPAIIFGDHTRAIKYIEEPFFIGADGVKILRPVNSQDNPKYLYYALQSARIPDLGYSRHFKAVKELEIRVYSTEEQNEIVRILEKIDHLIEQRHTEIGCLDQLVKSRFIELFGDYIQRSNKVFLEEISDFVTVGIANSATHAYTDSGIVMLRNQNIKENYLDENDLIYITPDFANKYGSKQLAENDILVIRTGYPGVACLVPKKYEGCQTFTTLIVRLKTATQTHANYVCHYINSSFGKNYVEQSKVGVAQQNFGAKALAKMPIAVPSEKLQEQFATFVEQTDKSKLAVQQGLQELEILKKSLMQQYFG